MKIFGIDISTDTRITGKAVPGFVQQQLPSLYRIARGITGHPSDAEDLVHDACVKALISTESVEFESENQFNTWLRRILINTYRDNYRRAVRSPVRPTEHHATSDDLENVVEMVESTDPSPLESIEHEQSSSAIQNAFSTLPPEVRVVSVLFLVSGLSYREIAAITDCPIGTVMSRLARGRKILRQELSAFFLEDDVGELNVSSGGDRP